MIEMQDLVAFYDHLTLHIVPGPRSLSYFIPFLLLPAALLIPPSILTHQQMRWTFIPISYSIQAYVWILHESFDVISMNHTLITFMLLGWYDVRTDFRYLEQILNDPPRQSQQNSVEEKEKRGINEDCSLGFQAEQPAFNLAAYPNALWARLKWVAMLCSSLRLTYWHVGLTSHDKRQSSAIRPFRSFFLNVVANTMLTYVILVTLPNFVVHEYCEPISSAAYKTVWDMMYRSLSLVIYIYATLSFFTSWLPTLIVLMIIAFKPSLQYNPKISPLTWPSHFGPLSSMWDIPTSSRSSFGLRAFWGVVWHQNMRQMTSTPGIALASWLGMGPGSLARYMTIVMSSFFWSGIVHMGVIPPQPIDTKSSVIELRLWLASFFWVQFIGIGIEVLVQNAILVSLLNTLSKSGKQRWWMSMWKFCALLWTFSFLATTTWWFIRPVGCEMGWWRLNLVNTHSNFPGC